VTDKLSRQEIMWQNFEELPDNEENGEDVDSGEINSVYRPIEFNK
jgi:hypothetical protein